MLGHIYLTLPGESPSIISKVLTRRGDAVDVFIILSGFVIFNLLDKKRSGHLPDILRRLFRIYPVHLVVLMASLAMVDLALGALADPFWQSPRKAARIGILIDTDTHVVSHLLAHLALAHGLIPSRWLPSAEYAILGQAWSISLEWRFYLAAPLCFWAVTRGGFRGALAILVMAAGAHYALRYFADEGFLPAAALYFVLGAGSYLLWKHQIGLAALGGTDLIAAVATGVVLTAILCPLPVTIWTTVLGALIIQGGATAFLPANLVVWCLHSRAMTWLGTISYSLYLVHMIPLYLALVLMPESLKENLLRRPYLFVVCSASLLLSWIAYHAIERPGIAAGKAITVRFSPAAPSPTRAS